MAHFSAFFTAIFLLICALLIEQFAMAQSYDQFLGNNDNNDDYEYRRSPANRASSSRNRLSHDQEEGDDMDENEGPPPPPGDGIGDIENSGEEDGGDEDSGFGGGDYRGDSGGDEENMDNGGGDVEGESSEDQGMLDPEEEDTKVQKLPTYSQYQYGGLRSNSRAHGQGYRLPGGYDISSSRSFDHLPSPYVDPKKMPTLPEKNEEYDEEDDSGGNSGDGAADYDGDSTADSPSRSHYERESLLAASPSDDYNNDYNYNDDKYNQNSRKAPDTLVT